MKNKGFSLVELIVVIAIMAILVGVAVPVYTSYISKAQQSKDIQMIDEIVHALEIGEASGLDFASGFIVLDGENAPSFENDMISSAELETYLETIFGEDLEGLTLSYDGWIVSSEVLTVVGNLSQAQIGAVNGSSYINSTTVPELLGNVQVVTTAASEFLGVKANDEAHFMNLLKLGLGSDYVEKAYQAGVIGKEGDEYVLLEGTYTTDGEGVVLGEDLSNQLANLMVFSVAAEMETLGDEDIANMMLYDFDPDYTPEQEVSPAALLAARYALYKAYAVDTKNEAAFDTMNQTLQSATSTTEIETAFSTFVEQCGESLGAYIQSNDGELFTNNALSVPAIMQGVSSVSGNYVTADQLKDANLFTSGAVASDLNTFIGATNAAAISADKLTALQNVTEGVVIFLNANGTISVVPNLK